MVDIMPVLKLFINGFFLFLIIIDFCSSYFVCYSMPTSSNFIFEKFTSHLLPLTLILCSSRNF